VLAGLISFSDLHKMDIGDLIDAHEVLDIKEQIESVVNKAKQNGNSS